MSVPFPVPAVVDNPDGWGPSTVPEHLKDMPFAPFNKGDKLGRVADWTQGAFGQKYGGRYAAGGGCALFGEARSHPVDTLRQAGATSKEACPCSTSLPTKR